jgi:hypothetical protein
MTYKTSKEKVDEVAAKQGYTSIDYQQNIGLVSYSKDGIRINVYLTTMTVGTCLIHPKKKATQLFRKNVDLKTLDKIFANPRVHTGKGYYKKNA